MLLRSQEIAFDIGGAQLAAKRWSNGPRRVIALHGWLDNAASFDRLAPLLEADIVALDLAGHGHSYHRTLQASYNIWDDLPDILRVANALEWPHFHLLGHSRGAIISGLLTAATPQRVASVVMLDGLIPETRPAPEFFDQLAMHLKQHLAPPGRIAHYASFGEALQARCLVSGMDADGARPIVVRGLAHDAQGWWWRSDRRLRLASAMRLSDEHVDVMIRQVVATPHLLLMAERAIKGSEQRREQIRDVTGLHWQMAAGGHHFHLENDVATTAEKINAFWKEVPGG